MSLIEASRFNSPWLLWAVPLTFAVLMFLIFVMRYLKFRRRTPQDPEQVLLLAVAESLQQRGQLAASLGELRTVHERVLDALPVGILWVDQRHQVAALNSKGQELLGVKRGVVGMDAEFVLEPFPWLKEGLAKAPGESWRLEINARRFELRRIEAPDKVGSLLQFSDITELEIEENRRALRERFAELGEMTAGVAHQLKNGLAVLKGHGQLLRRAGQQAVAQDLLDETDSLDRLVQRFLQWAKPLDPQCADLDLQEVALQAVEEIRRRPAARELELTSEGQGRAFADPMLLHQALVNLLENACQASPKGAKVRVWVSERRMAIEDEGPGFTEATFKQMLRPFESGRPEGTGLGLPLALKWLNATGADLHFQRREEGGTRLEIRW